MELKTKIPKKTLYIHILLTLNLMKKFTIKTACVAIFLFFVVAIINVNGQKVYIVAADYGTPAMAANDIYEIGYLVLHYNGSTPDQSWDSPTATYLPTGNPPVFPFPSVQPFVVNNFNPNDSQAHFKVLVTIKRRSGTEIICGGQKLSAFMTPYDLLNTQFTVGTVNLTNP